FEAGLLGNERREGVIDAGRQECWSGKQPLLQTLGHLQSMLACVPTMLGRRSVPWKQNFLKRSVRIFDEARLLFHLGGGRPCRVFDVGIERVSHHSECSQHADEAVGDLLRYAVVRSVRATVAADAPGTRSDQSAAASARRRRKDAQAR